MASEHKQFSRYATPPQATITQNHCALAASVADILESNPNASSPPVDHVLPYHLIVRDSVRYGDTSPGKRL